MEQSKQYRVGLFGPSRSGKNYTIENFISEAGKHGLEFIHVSPIDMVRERLDGRKLSEMGSDEKITLVNGVRRDIDVLSSKNNIVVDEHYCFPSEFGGRKQNNGYYDEKLPFDIYSDPSSGSEFEVVFPRFEYRKYDCVAVMDIDPGSYRNA